MDSQPEFRCPFCRAEIPPADVNVATDMALCRSCGRVSSFALVGGAAEVSLEVLAAPPRGIRVETDFRGSDRIIYRRLSPALLFFVPFTALWSGISMWGIYGTQFVEGKFDLGRSLFGLPFLIGTVVLVGVIVFLLFGRWELRLQEGAGTVFVGVGPLGWTRNFAYGRDTLVSLRTTDVRVNDVPQQGIVVRTGEGEFVFGAVLKGEVKRFVAAAILRAVKES
jgi:hypothetical protein